MKSRVFGFLYRVKGTQFVLAVLLLSISAAQAHRPRKLSGHSVAQQNCTHFGENWPSEIIRRGLKRNVNDSVTWMQKDKTTWTGRRKRCSYRQRNGNCHNTSIIYPPSLHIKQKHYICTYMHYCSFLHLFCSLQSIHPIDTIHSELLVWQQYLFLRNVMNSACDLQNMDINLKLENNTTDWGNKGKSLNCSDHKNSCI